jgi:hypothetical protein
MKEQALSQGMKESNNFLQLIRSILDGRRDELITITTSLNALSRSIRLNDPPESIKEKAESFQSILRSALLPRIRIRPKRRLQRVILSNLNLLLTKLIEDIDKQHGRDGWAKAELYYVCLKFLGYRFDQALNIEVDLDALMRESEPSLNTSSPPRWHFILYMLAPVLVLFILVRDLKPSEFANILNSPPKLSQCERKTSTKERSLINQNLINNTGHGYFERIKWTFHSRNAHSSQPPSAFTVEQNWINDLKSTDNKINPGYTIRSNNLPMIRILANNDKIDQVKKESRKNVFNVLLLIPLKRSEVGSPSAWSLGILKGLDLAQREIISAHNNNLIKIMIVNEENVTPLAKASGPILDLVSDTTEPIVGIIGLEQDSLMNLYSICLNEYKHVPAFTSSIRYFQGVNNDFPELSLLPSLHEIAESMLEDIRKRRKSNTNIEAAPSKLTVVYDQSESNSKILADAICNLAQDDYASNFPKCTLIEITSRDSKDYQDSLNFEEGNNHELILAVNPFGSNNIELENYILGHLRSFLQSKAKEGWMYVSPYFMDKLLEERIIAKASDQLKECGDSCSQVEPKFFLIRIAPIDWRSAPSDFKLALNKFERRDNPYGNQLNWSTINSYNNLMTLHKLIGNSVSEMKQTDFSDVQDVADIRTRISNQLRESKYDATATMGGNIRVERQGTQMVVRGPGIEIHSGKIDILPHPPVGTKKP